MVKVTFSLDDATVAQLRRTAERKKKPQSWVVREAIAEYGARADTLTPEEKQRMLAALERLRHAPVERSQADVDREIADLRASRRTAGLRRPVR
jgi:predicted transcriptional regulator